MAEPKYQIESSGHLCRGCEEEIAYGDGYFSAVIYETEVQAFARRDFCGGCWSAGAQPAVRPLVSTEGEATEGTETEGTETEGTETEGTETEGTETEGTETEGTETEGTETEGTETEGTETEGTETEGEAPEGEEADVAIRFFAFWKTRRPEPNAPPPTKIRFDAEIVLDFFRHLTPEDDGAQSENAADQESSDETIGESGTYNAEASLGDAELAASNSEDLGDGDLESTSASAAVGSELYPTQKRDLRFVLALLLLRKKVLNFIGSAMDEGNEWLKLADKADPPREYWVENPELSDGELERVRDDLGELLQMNV